MGRLAHKMGLSVVMAALLVMPLLVMLWDVHLGGAFLLLSWPFATRVLQ